MLVCIVVFLGLLEGAFDGDVLESDKGGLVEELPCEKASQDEWDVSIRVSAPIRRSSVYMADGNENLQICRDKGQGVPVAGGKDGKTTSENDNNTHGESKAGRID